MEGIEQKYNEFALTPSDINEHLPTLYAYAKECETILECGVRGCISSYALSLGLLHNQKPVKRLTMNDLTKCDIEQLLSFGKETDLELKYEWRNDLELEIGEVDLTFIDTYHVYGQLKRELSKFAPLTNMYMIMHDTEVDKIDGECTRCGWSPETMAQRTAIPVEEHSIGLQKAIDEFLQQNADWRVKEAFVNNNGLTVLERI
jgi:hypothetical protein